MESASSVCKISDAAAGKTKVATASPTGLFEADDERASCTTPCTTPCTTTCTTTCLAKIRTISPSSRSKGLLAMPCATSHVKITLIGHSNNSGASIQSSISPNNERCSFSAGAAVGFSTGAVVGFSAGADSVIRSLEFSQGNSPGRALWQCAPGLAQSFCAIGGCKPQSRCCSLLRPIRTAAPPAGLC